jgi:hypothetical protein
VDSVSSRVLELGQQVERLGLVPLEGSQADTIEESAHLFLGAAFLHRQANDLLLSRTHAVNGRAQLSSGQRAGRAIRAWEREDDRPLTPGHDTEKLADQMAHLEMKPLGGIAGEWNSRPKGQGINERFW